MTLKFLKPLVNDNVADVPWRLGQAVLDIYLDTLRYEARTCQRCGGVYYRPKDVAWPQLCNGCRQPSD